MSNTQSQPGVINESMNTKAAETTVSEEVLVSTLRSAEVLVSAQADAEKRCRTTDVPINEEVTKQDEENEKTANTSDHTMQEHGGRSSVMDRSSGDRSSLVVTKEDY